MRYCLPNFGMVFGEDPNSSPNEEPQSSKEQRIAALRAADPEVYSIVFGKGLTKGKKETTDVHLRVAVDERYDKALAALKGERIQRVIREKAKVMNFMNPEDAVMFISNSLTLNEDFEVVLKDDGSVTTIDESLKQLAQMSPHLIRSNQRPGEGSKRQATPTAGFTMIKPTFKRSQLQDENFYRQNEQQILQAAKDGRIIDDMKGR